MPRVRIGAAYKTGNTTCVALLQVGNKVALQVYAAQTPYAASTPTDTIIVEKASSLVYAGEQTSNIFTCAEQVRILLQEMREGVQAFDAIIVITRHAIQVTLARKCPPAEMQATLQEDIPSFIQKLQEVDNSGVLGVGVARVRASGPRMLAWITYGGPDGVGALSLEGGALFSFLYTEVRMQGNNPFRVALYLLPMHSIYAQQMFE